MQTFRAFIRYINKGKKITIQTMRKTIIACLLFIIAGAAQGKQVVWEQPSTETNTEIEGYFHTLLEITRVELAKDETRLFMHVASRPENWVRFSSGTYLVADGKHYALRSLDGMELDKETFLTDHGYTDVVLHFEPLPMKTQRFDFTEGDFDGAWKLLGIEDAKTRAGRLFPSNWRNVQTGDWDISFYEDFAIYDCQFWQYKQKDGNGDAYSITLENGGKEIVVNVGKNKKGHRSITIDGKQGEYSLITSICLPDYPTKDTSTEFKDSHYQTDTVTLVGWLKDMPQWMKDAGRAYEVTHENIFSGKQESSYDKMDSLGRFTIKIPMLNSSEVYADWKRTFIRTLLEPGETYFLLYDFKGGHKIFMGKNSRLQNETLAYPIQWVGGHSGKRNMDEAEAMAFLDTIKASKADAMQELETTIKEHPNISNRYINYLHGHYSIEEGEALMQGRFSMKDRHVPAEYLDYVSREIWQKLPKPYTLYRAFDIFKRDYIGQLVYEQCAITGPKFTFLSYYDMYAPILRLYRDAGKVALTDDELAAVECYSKELPSLILQNQQSEENRQVEAPEADECVLQGGKIFEREDIKAVLLEMGPMLSLYKTHNILDSLGCDQDLRDIIMAGEFYNSLDHERTPLSETAMKFMEDNTKMQFAKAFIKAEQKKFLALQRRDISNSDNLKSAEDVANLSDGEQILRKLIEPYKGKIILLDIWGTWCGPCKDALSRSQAEYERLKDYDLVYLYLANNSSDESWQNVIKMYDVTGDNVVHYNLPTAQQSAIENFLQIHEFPTYKLIDRNGTILEVNADPRNLDALENVLKQIK